MQHRQYISLAAASFQKIVSQCERNYEFQRRITSRMRV
jgi:hypothetical protein